MKRAKLKRNGEEKTPDSTTNLSCARLSQQPTADPPVTSPPTSTTSHSPRLCEPPIHHPPVPKARQPVPRRTLQGTQTPPHRHEQDTPKQPNPHCPPSSRPLIHQTKSLSPKLSSQHPSHPAKKKAIHEALETVSALANGASGDGSEWLQRLFVAALRSGVVGGTNLTSEPEEEKDGA